MTSIKQAILEAGLFALDFEATAEKKKDAVNPWVAKPTLISLATHGASEVFEIDANSVSLLKELLSNKNLKVIIHNINYDIVLMHASKLVPYKDIKADIFDTAVLFWLVNEEEPHNLKYLVKKYLRYQMVSYNEVMHLSEASKKLAANAQEKKILLKNKESILLGRKILTDNYLPISWNKYRLTLSDKTAAELREIKKTSFSATNSSAHIARLEERLAQIELENSTLIKTQFAEFKEYAKDDTVQLIKLYEKGIDLYKRRYPKTTEKMLGWLKIEQTNARIAVEMQINGCSIDLALIQKLDQKMTSLEEELLGTVYDLAKTELNVNSPKQLHDFFFKELEINPPIGAVHYRQNKKPIFIPPLSKSGEKYCKQHSLIINALKPEKIPVWLRENYGFKTDEATLKCVKHPVAQAILNYRAVKKLRSTYITGLLTRQSIFQDNKLHSNFSTARTKTGRWASSNMNLQNIPSRAKSDKYDIRLQNLGSSIRKAFIPDEGHDLIVADHSQIELRIITEQSKDATLFDVYTAGVEIDGMFHYTGDIHARTSAALNVPRKYAKSINFGRVVHLSRIKTRPIQRNPSYRAILSESIGNSRSVQRLTAQTDRLRTGYVTT